MSYNISKREYKLEQIFGHSWALFKDNFWIILPIILLVYVPLNILTQYITPNFIDPLQSPLQQLRTYIILALEFLIGIIATMAIAYAIDQRLKKKKVDYSKAILEAFTKWPTAIGTSIMTTILLILLFLLLIVPGVIFSVYWVFMLYAIILRNKSWKGALDYSKAVVKNRWWKTLGVIVAITVSALVVTFAASIPFLFTPDQFLINLLIDTFVDVVDSFFTVVMIVFFINFDLNRRKR